jgi:hypothetical protein
MRLSGRPRSWQIRVDRWNEVHDLALWIRAAERIEVPAGAAVPGPLDIDRLPAPTIGPTPELAEGWRGWWQALVGLPRFEWRPPEPPPGPPPQSAFFPPHFDGLAGWPLLRAVLARRFDEAHAWHTGRTEAELPGRIPQMPNLSRIVSGARGWRARPFLLDLVVLPVLDDEVRQVGDDRYLVPERIFDGPDFPGWLRAVVTRLP